MCQHYHSFRSQNFFRTDFMCEIQLCQQNTQLPINRQKKMRKKWWRKRNCTLLPRALFTDDFFDMQTACWHITLIFIESRVSLSIFRRIFQPNLMPLKWEKKMYVLFWYDNLFDNHRNHTSLKCLPLRPIVIYMMRAYFVAPNTMKINEKKRVSIQT